ncbi:hypothetical protein IAT38_003609 [Cryptococcus sp. DSM 104549]
MVSTLHLIITGAALLLAVAYLHVASIRKRKTQLYNLQGPPADSLLVGVLPRILSAPPNDAHGTWFAQYGPTLRYPTVLGKQTFTTVDPVTLTHILAHPDTFPKPPFMAAALADLVGNGAITTEGEVHRRQRRALAGSFSPAAIQGMAPIFFNKAYELSTKLRLLVESDPLGEASPTPALPVDRKEGGRKIDMLKWLNKTTLDIIGLAGFSYDLGTLDDQENELAETYRTFVTLRMETTFLSMLQNIVPGLRHLPTRAMRKLKKATRRTREICASIVEERKRSILAAHNTIEKNVDIGNDLLSILMKANMASDIRPDLKLSDEEVVSQITTVMIAGHETTSNAVNWVLYMLSQHPDVHARLREELNDIIEDRPSLDTLQSLPYLDAVVHETLRLYAPAPKTYRQAMEDSVIPLGKAVVGRDGRLMESVLLEKGTNIFIPIANVNTTPLIWGRTGNTFDPSRFLSPSPSSHSSEVPTPFNPTQIPGVWGNLLTFLGGSHNCVGYRFALAEIKVLLFVLVRGFEFEELGSGPVVTKKATLVVRPVVVGEESAGVQMPLMVTPLT